MLLLRVFTVKSPMGHFLVPEAMVSIRPARDMRRRGEMPFRYRVLGAFPGSSEDPVPAPIASVRVVAPVLAVVG